MLGQGGEVDPGAGDTRYGIALLNTRLARWSSRNRVCTSHRLAAHALNIILGHLSVAASIPGTVTVVVRVIRGVTVTFIIIMIVIARFYIIEKIKLLVIVDIKAP